MISSIELRNFQSHKQTKLELSPNVNAIVGASDKGKSAILRGLRWAIENRPSGDSFVSDWIKTEKGGIKAENECRVTIRKGSIELSRIRSKELNGYEIDGVELEAIRTSVPEQVVEFFNLSEVNIQRQMDAPFLISQSPGEVSRFFNRVIHLEEIDKMLTGADGKKREITRNIKATEEGLEGLKERRLTFAWLEGVELSLASADALEKEVETFQEAKNTLEELAEKYEQANRQLNQAEKILETEAKLKKAGKLQNTIQDISKKINHLHPTLEEHEIQTQRITSTAILVGLEKKTTKALTRLQKSEQMAGRVRQLSKLVEAYDEALEVLNSGLQPDRLLEKLEIVKDAKEKIELLKGAIKAQQKTLLQYESQLQTVRQDKREIRELQKQLPETCPTCGASIKGTK